MSLFSKINAKLDFLRNHLERLQPGLIAVSGGVDSRFLAHAAWLWKLDFRAAHAVGPHQSDVERRQSLAWLKAQNRPVHVIAFDPLLLPQVQNNSPRRCYWCKKALFSRLHDLAVEQSAEHVLDGTQADDAHEHRPGRHALRELGVHSPFVQAGMGKTEIRLAAEKLGLSDPEQPSRACLLTRFPYSSQISRQQLEAVGRVEDHLSALGLRQFRFRVLGDKAFLLQLHLDEHQSWQAIREQAIALITNQGLAPFDVRETKCLSGFFDKE